jgi:tetratricopeptide (TPR) repeat protein
MKRGIRFAAVAGMLAAASFVVHTSLTAQSESAEIQLQLGHQLMSEGRYQDAVAAFQRALTVVPGAAREARVGIVQAALRLGAFEQARAHADALLQASPRDPVALALAGDALWAAGLFQEAEARFHESLELQPNLARGRHGLARSLAAQSKLDEAMTEAQLALKLSPRDSELHHTAGVIFERRHQFEEAASAFSSYLNLLPNRDRGQQSQWARSAVVFLRSFENYPPFEMEPGTENNTFTVDFRVVNDKVIVRGRINNGRMQDFVIDTGAEHAVLSRSTAQRLGVKPLTTTLGGGVGEVGLRSLQLARLDSLEVGSLKIKNVPAIIKDPALRNLPSKEGESLSPLSLGFSMIVDYKTRKLTVGRTLPSEPGDFELPLRLHRLAVVRGTVDKNHPTNFVVDTGGEVISISKATATQLKRPEPLRRIPLKVYGSSGWDRDAFLMPNVDLAFDAIHYPRYSVVVLNLNVPSALLGFQVGGTVGHSFLSKYRVGIDLRRSVLRLADYES